MDILQMERQRVEIGKAIETEIRSQKIAIEKIERDGKVSKRVIYNIIQAKNYNINSLLSVLGILKKGNSTFEITV